MTDRFDEASAVERVAEGRFAAQIPDGWQQGRGAFGGLGVGVALRAIEATEPDRPIRAATAELPGPLLVGPAEIEVRVLRRGSRMSTVDARVLQDGETKVRASAVMSQARVEGLDHQPPRPTLGDWRAVEPITGLPPRFARHYELRPTGAPPFGGASEPTAEGWVRPRAALPRWGAPELAALVDVYWPTLFATLTAPRPMATVSFTLQLTERAHALPMDAPLFLRARGLSCSGGYAAELRELWTADGELVALNPQTFAVVT